MTFPHEQEAKALGFVTEEIAKVVHGEPYVPDPESRDDEPSELEADLIHIFTRERR